MRALFIKGYASPYSVRSIRSIWRLCEKIQSYIEASFGGCPSWVHVVDALDDVATYYHAADVFVSAAREEGLCYSPIEAAYCGCAIISSEIDGVPYQAIPYCRTFPSENVALLRKTLLESIVPNTPEQKKEAAAAVVAQFDLDTWAEKEIETLEKVAGTNSVRP